MSLLILLLAGGYAFQPGAGLLVLAVLVSLWHSSRWITRAGVVRAYGLAQRRIASQYQIAMIPRRYFVNILAASTSDGIHLTPTGQHQMADLVWRVVGHSIAVK